LLKFPDVSAYIRNAELLETAGTPACVSVIPPTVYEKIRFPEGVILPLSGVTITDPVTVV
jgi:hypothetical protein